MRKLGLDLGTKCGWALESDTRIFSGTWDLSVGRFSGGGMRYVRFEKMLNEVLESVAGKNLNAVYFEEVRRHAGTDAAHVYGGLMAILTSWCEKHGIPYQGIPVGTIKKCATGKGNADKQAMIEAAKHAWPDQDIKDDNQADALWVLRSSDAVGL